MPPVKDSPSITLFGAGTGPRKIWVPALKLAGQRVRAVIDPDASARASFGQEIAQVEQYEAICDEALDASDLVIVATPNSFHADHAVLCLSRGVDVIIEKPVCFHRDDADRIIKAARATGSRFWCSSAVTHRLDMGWIADRVADGTVGTVHAIDLAWRRAAGVPHAGSWFTRKAIAKGGSGADLGWHLLDAGLSLMGYPGITSAQALNVTPDPGSPDAAPSWYDERISAASISEPEEFSVENQMFASLIAGSCQVRLSTAWSSHQSLDTTDITVFGSDAEITLRTTFGFSPRRRSSGVITLLRKGLEERFELSEADQIDPYFRFLRHVFERRKDGAVEDACEARKLRCLSDAMYQMYRACR